MPLNQIKVKGYKSIRDLDLNLTNLNVLIGANGAGKSNFVYLFKLLNNIIEGNLQRYVMQEGGSESLLYYGQKYTDKIQIKKIGSINDNLYLRPDASNLAAFLYLLKNTKEEYYLAIRDTIRLVNPFFNDFLLRPFPGNEDFIRLEWHERGSDYPFLAHHISDGTLRFMCLATLLLQPKLPSTILVDEPELGLHPYAIVVLASLIKSASERTQIIISTQSVSLVNQFSAEDLLIVERNENNGMYETTISSVDPQRLSSWLEEYSLGELWGKNVLGGRPQ